MKYLLAGLVAALLLTSPLLAREQAPDPKTLFTNVNVFDGVRDQLIEYANVLIEGNLIKTVSADPITAEGATVIDGGGRTLMPGLAVPDQSSRKNRGLSSGLNR